MTDHPTLDSIDDEFFDSLYSANPDPWRFAASPYERAKYRSTLAALPRPRFRRALEVGCSIGVMTRMLARSCRRLIAVDVSQAALRQARRRRRGLAGVTVQRIRLPQECPAGTFDLILLSEVLYFLSASDIAQLADLVVARLQPHGVLVLVNWTGATGTAVDGTRARSLFLGRAGGRLRRLTQQRRPGYRLDVLRRRQ